MLETSVQTINPKHFWIKINYLKWFESCCYRSFKDNLSYFLHKASNFPFYILGGTQCLEAEGIPDYQYQVVAGIQDSPCQGAGIPGSGSTGAEGIQGYRQQAGRVASHSLRLTW